MPMTVRLPVFMRVGEKGEEQLIGHATVDLSTEAMETDFGRADDHVPDMLERAVDDATEQEDTPDAPA
ncbi:hypothetical protein GCM10010294_25050 [Streptomyces griseoloalbus]|uniref:hypothetical protein n=1 Tax=Streptomyces griseoloalbus TaxID=67303 RepID=UPI00187576FB|nr:hypothetical protein GCM10010294_25050 [Streptomyces griseoloalbus]